MLQLINSNPSKRNSGFGDEEVKRFFENYKLEIYSEKTKGKEEILDYGEFLMELFHLCSSKF